ncbi:MAG: efflux RND transporter periplasmic adaptor subunit [Candidatus Omnitrophica bacterium]|nr:efflux RND transporter periplasmic adaptor subunit [Candidatus Omnitrophota bacterium]
MKKSLKIFLILLFITTYNLQPTTYGLFAQHEGHKPEGSGRASDSPSHKQEAQTKPETKVKQTTKQKDIYYCPMHPTYTSERPGDCPICNMKLVKRQEGQEIDKKEEPKQEGFYISPDKQQLIGVKIDKAAFRPLIKVIRTVGRVAFDPELYKSQQEYIEAVKMLEKVEKPAQADIVQRVQGLVDAAALKLELSGLSKEQIEKLARNKENDPALLISSSDAPLTWVYATIYEYELEWVKIGQDATINATSYPGKEFKGKIASIDPVFDATTRSARARLKVANLEGLLKPNMYVDVVIRSDLGEHLAVPAEAILDSGLRKIVFVPSPEGYFQARDIKTGVSADDYVQIIEGVKEGENVVVSGNFLIDSESKLKAALEGADHQH